MTYTDTFMEIHTSSRNCFRRCRRKWYLRDVERLQPVGATSFPLWFGTGFHWALENLHGDLLFDDPKEAFTVYYNAFDEKELPPDAEESVDLAFGMLDHYLNYWLKRRGGEYKTLYVDGEAQTEVDFTLTLPALSEELGIEIIYKGTFDRVVEDSDGNIWIEDYKTASSIDTSKLETDPQISMYKWAAESWYGMPIEGVLYTQFKKKVPKEPRILKSGKLSTAKNQATTYALYKEELDRRFPDGNYSEKHREVLGYLAQKETPEGDPFIRRDRVWRNVAQAKSEYKHLCQEVRDMKLTMEKHRTYPNPTRDCSWDCDFRTLCIAMDDGSDADHLVDTMFEDRPPRDERPWKLKVQQLKEEYSG